MAAFQNSPAVDSGRFIKNVGNEGDPTGKRAAKPVPMFVAVINSCLRHENRFVAKSDEFVSEFYARSDDEGLLPEGVDRLAVFVHHRRPSLGSDEEGWSDVSRHLLAVLLAAVVGTGDEVPACDSTGKTRVSRRSFREATDSRSMQIVPEVPDERREVPEIALQVEGDAAPLDFGERARHRELPALKEGPSPLNGVVGLMREREVDHGEDGLTVLSVGDHDRRTSRLVVKTDVRGAVEGVDHPAASLGLEPSHISRFVVLEQLLGVHVPEVDAAISQTVEDDPLRSCVEFGAEVALPFASDLEAWLISCCDDERSRFRCRLSGQSQLRDAELTDRVYDVHLGTP